ncbi:MAG: HAD family hydrolase [Candidatus Helarchaeota archaeon]
MAIISNQYIDIENKKAIIFDWDGTLFNNVPAIKTATKDVLNQFEINYPVDDAVEEFLDLMEKIDTSDISKIVLNSYKLLEKMSFIENLTYTEKLQALFMIYSRYKRYSENSQLFQGAEELLKQLSEKFDLAIFTSTKKKSIEGYLEKFGIKNYFKSVLSVDDVNNPKPHPEGIFRMMSMLNYDAKNIMYIGDLKTDIVAARAANVNSIAVSNGLIPHEELLSEQPDLICNHITELTAIFNLPEIKIDMDAEQKLDLSFHERRIKRVVSEEFHFFELLRQVSPRKLEAEELKRIIIDPLGYVGAVIEDGITKYSQGEVQLSSELEVFSGMEEDLLRCLGLIIIHFVNERSNNIIERVINNQLLGPSTTLFLGLFKFGHQNFYPVEYKIRFKEILRGLFQRILPENIYEKLNQMDPKDFSNHVLDGCELALVDLGFKKPDKFDFPIKKIIFSPINYLLKIPNQIFTNTYGRVKHVITDILENDFRRLPTRK